MTKPIPERDHRELAEKIFAQDPNSLALANTWHQRNLSPLEEIRGMDLARISSHCEDDFNRLIKKLRVSFSEKLAEAQFSIEEGIFHGARFHLTAEDRDLTIKISQIAMPLKLLLSNNREVLKTRLAQHEINLCDMRFI
ncbi:MAG TPA: hypothetical protein VEL47_06840 [Myxococcota bacterium]|nr:hypothetical protein [Myxococcota bacterium]